MYYYCIQIGSMTYGCGLGLPEVWNSVSPTDTVLSSFSSIMGSRRHQRHVDENEYMPQVPRELHDAVNMMRPMCIHYTTKKGCKRGNKCTARYLH